jgi:hypothetical protein
MKYLISWKTRFDGSAAENEASAARILEVYNKWAPEPDVTIHQFVLRADGQGGFAVTESDNPAAGVLTTFKLSPFVEYEIYPVPRHRRRSRPLRRGHRVAQVHHLSRRLRLRSQPTATVGAHEV